MTTGTVKRRLLMTMALGVAVLLSTCAGDPPLVQWGAW